MKYKYPLLIAAVLCSLYIFTACGSPNASQSQQDDLPDTSIVSKQSDNAQQQEESIIYNSYTKSESKPLVYEARTRKPRIILTSRNQILKADEDYTLEYNKNQTSPGIYHAVVTLHNNYSGKMNVDYTILPPSPVIRDISTRIDEFHFTMSDEEKIDGYEIVYSENEDFSDPIVKKTSERAFTVSDLPHNKEYYIRARTYLLCGGSTIVSPWSQTMKAELKRIEVRDGITYIDGTLVVNKTYSVPEDYGKGEDREALSALNKMCSAAAEDNIYLYSVSGYRSYSLQNDIYNGFKAERGEENADKVSARPGHSEHQTGLAFDINTTSYAFVGTPEAKWLADHCCEYGFVIRYPEGKEAVTGYSYEPWHVRYLGKDLAEKLVKSGLTLEEYYGITSRYSQ